MALAVYVGCPSAYNALKELGIMQLPSERSLKDFTGAKLFAPGAEAWESHIKQEASRYNTIKEELTSALTGSAAKLRIPQQEGVLIFDEVKVIGKIMWNSKSQQVYGLAMSLNDLSSLHDIYTTIDPKVKTQKAKYCLQFLWRDCTSDFDLVGPYYTSEGVQQPSHIIACLQDTMRLLHRHGFVVNSIVCDGASTNLATIKNVTGAGKGPYGMSDQPVPNPHDVSSWFWNWFQPDIPVFWIICPSHQLKNMINALWQSKPVTGRSRGFVTHLGGPVFGWEAVEDMWKRDKDRRARNVSREVPSLQESFIKRDAWTKLNVRPAKVMQQEQVLAELAHHALSADKPQPSNAATTIMTRDYLQP
ncbi:PREDICTED: uncharacterized protein LOC106812541 [Priapulus caudatus]|uniref:Uncharacterized protein LOC106812541 n=1 Tax=Priapulus caudatus TaxID=37621 RepID=A0ABM1EIA1_PRICU|nr:PREDICTED: uncharacterized protein LOC106812541 [Priapulus caudatus]